MMKPEVRSYLKKFVQSSRIRRPIGLQGEIRVGYFLDLLSAAHDPGNSLLVETLASEMGSDPVVQRCDNVVVPKRGNCLFGKAVGDRLGKRTAVVRDNILFSRWIEGFVRSGQRAILVDDVASDGELLRHAVENLRRAGVFVEKVWVLVNRSDGDSRTALSAVDTELAAVFDIDDEQLRAILEEDG